MTYGRDQSRVSERNWIGAGTLGGLRVRLLLAHHRGQKRRPALLLGLRLVRPGRLGPRRAALDGLAVEQRQDLLAGQGLVLEERLGHPLQRRLVLGEEPEGALGLLGDHATELGVDLLRRVLAVGLAGLEVAAEEDLALAAGEVERADGLAHAPLGD